MNKAAILQAIKGGLVVSCQALPGEPLQGSGIMAKMALAAKQGGAVGIRANGYEDIVLIKKEVDLPIIGIIKANYSDSEVFITPTMKEVDLICRAGAEIVALDATQRLRPFGQDLKTFVQEIRSRHPEVLLMADISTYEEGLAAEALGFDLIGTTLSGYTSYSKNDEDPDYDLMLQLVQTLNTPIVAEGKINTPEDLEKSFKCGVYCAVVGSSITRPQEITKRFTRAIPRE